MALPELLTIRSSLRRLNTPELLCAYSDALIHIAKMEKLLNVRLPPDVVDGLDLPETVAEVLRQTLLKRGYYDKS